MCCWRRARPARARASTSRSSRARASDPACWPGEVAELAWLLEGGKLVPLDVSRPSTRSTLDGDVPGAVTIGAAAKTRKACAPAVMAVETRYLAQLAQATGFGFLLGRLAVNYSSADGTPGVMLFAAEESPTAP